MGVNTMAGLMVGIVTAGCNDAAEGAKDAVLDGKDENAEFQCK